MNPDQTDRDVDPTAIQTEFDAARAALIEKTAPATKAATVDWSGGQTEVLELGSGSPLVLIHGAFSNAGEWMLVLSGLAQGHKVLAVDMPGHGGADPFDYTNIDLNQHAVTFVGDVLDALSIDSAAIIGNSMGGLLAGRFATQRPERVTRLLFVGCPVGFRRKAPFLFRMLAVPYVPRLAMGNPTPKGSRKFMGQGLGVAHPERLPDELIDADVANALQNIESFMTLTRTIGDIIGIRRRWLLDDAWDAMPQGTAILWGENEPFGSPQWATSKLSRLNADIEVVPIQGAGHLPHWDEPETVVQEAKRHLNR